jgi:putative two-component system response regulator
MENLKNARVLVLDDEPANTTLLQRVLQRDGYSNVRVLNDARLVEEECAQHAPDVLLLDLMMPHVDGYAIMEQIQSMERATPILVMTADVTPETKRRALSSGAKDFVTKPFDTTEILLRVRNLLETHILYRKLREQNQLLEMRVAERTQDLLTANTSLEKSNTQLERSQRELEKSQIEILERLAQAAEFRDDDTGRHTHRVGEMSAMLAQMLGLPEEWVDLIRRTAPLHDVGKIGVSDSILLKPGKLTTEEFEIMKTHTVIGSNLLTNGISDLVQTAERIALSHHERWIGNGYPHGLNGEAIPIEGRILAVADVFDALTHARPYKKAWPIGEAVAEIEKQSGEQFDPQVVAAFLTLPHERLV